MADRLGWFWLLAEPIAMVAVMAAIRSYMMSGHHIYGAEFIPWLIVGLMGFNLFRDIMMRSVGAVDANRGLFAYRQVKPIDAVLVRCFLEGLLKTFILLLFIAAGLLLGIDMHPDNTFAALFGWLSLWLLGAGIGLCLSALSSLIPEIGYIVRIMSLPLLLLSGVIFPLQIVPHEIQAYLIFNPIAHGLEIIRTAFFDQYHSLNGISMIYLWGWISSLGVIGLALHIRFELRLKAQ